MASRLGGRTMTTRQFARRRFGVMFPESRFAAASGRRRAAERQRRERQGRLHHARLLTKAEWTVGHRELQLVRAQATGNGKYITKRTHLLNAAIQRLEQLQAGEMWTAKP